ncbi:MAG: hypothetical protein ACRCWI_05250 [Brevinema sp.]
MKKIILGIVFVAVLSPAHTAQNYNPGNLLLGIGIGAGTASVYPIGSPQMTIHPSVELIVGTWGMFALGVTVDSSINFINELTGTIAPMLTGHFTLAPRFDMYLSLGMGLQLLPVHGTTGAYNIHVGFATGFNVVITPAFLWNIGMAIHADQLFGSTGVIIRFGDASKIQYRK